MATINKYTTKDGQKRYMFRLYLGIDPQTGKKKQTTRRGFKTQKEAKIEISRLQLQVDQDGDIKKDNNITFAEVYHEFILGYQTTVRASTLYNGRNIFNKHILPVFGNKRIRTIKAADIQKWVNSLKHNYSTTMNVIGRAKRIFNYAYKAEYISNNPFRLVTIPKSEEKNKHENYYSKEELITFFDAEYFKKEKHLHVLVFFRLLAFSGLRKGEALALNWSDIDLNNKMISVNKTVSLREHSRFELNKPKNDAGEREVPIDDTTINMLKHWQLVQKQIMLINGINSYNKDSVVFSRDGLHHFRNTAPNEWLDVIYRHNPELKVITPHGFRHTHASLLFAAGVSVKEAQVRLGHTNVQMTLNIYTHLTSEQKAKTVDKLTKYADF